MPAARKRKRKPSKRCCDVCGDGDKHYKRMVVRVDGELVASWRLCRSCCAIKQVILGDHRRYR